MPPKFLLVKTQSKRFWKLLQQALTGYPHVPFYTRKMNGVYTVVIKCQAYYDFLKEQHILIHPANQNSIYLSYIYLYTSLSMILSDLMIRFFEEKITRQILTSKYSYLSSYDMMRFSNITHAVLDSNFPSFDAKKLYLYRKELIFHRLLLNFRNRNYIQAEHFAFFKLSNYHHHLEDIIEKTYSHY